MLDTKKVQQRITELLALLRGYMDLTAKDKAKLTKADRSRIAALEDDLSAILEPEHRSDFTTDVNGIARFFGVTARSVQLWTAKGCPKLKHGRYDLKFVHEWWVENISTGQDSADTENVKLEYWRWKTANERMKAEQTSGELIPRADIATAWSARMIEVGTGLYALSSRLSHVLEVPETPIRAEVKKLHDAYCRTGRFCVTEAPQLPAPARRGPGRPRKK